MDFERSNKVDIDVGTYKVANKPVHKIQELIIHPDYIQACMTEPIIA